MLLVYGSPRAEGNSHILLDSLAVGARAMGAEVQCLHLHRLTYSGCIACGGCEKTGVCVLDDDLRPLYPDLTGQRTIVLAFPMFFYGPPAMTKAFIDRAQACWCGRAGQPAMPGGQRPRRGTGYLLGVGASKGEKLFMPSELICRYFFDALDMSYGGGLFFRGLEGKGAVQGKPDMLKAAYDWGGRLAACDENIG